MEISKTTKYIFLLHFITMIIFGAWYFVSPESWSTLTGWPDAPSTGRMFGAALIAMGLGALFAFRASTWEEVEIIVLMELIWNIVGLVGMIWNFAYLTLPVVGWALVGLLGLFFILYFYVYYDAKLKKA